MASSKYKFDMNIGHYVLLLEGEAPQTDGSQDQSQNQDQNQEQTQKPQVQMINLDSKEVIAMRQEKANQLKTLQDDIEKKTNNVVQCQQAVANIQQQSDKADQSQLNAAQKTLIQANKELADAKFNMAKKENEYDNKIFQLQAKLVESIETARRELPLKYQALNESNIQNAKVYLNKIFDNDYQERIKGMVDFKKAFANSNLLFGKDKGGYFAVCVDQEDMNKLTNTLIEVGYNKDDIYSVVLSQMFDRSDLVKA